MQFLEDDPQTKRGYTGHRFRLNQKGKDIVEQIYFSIRACSPDRGVDFAQIQCIEEVPASGKYVYDLEVPSVECFFAGFGGVLVHNSRGDHRTVPGKDQLTGSTAFFDVEHGDIFDNREAERKLKRKERPRFNVR